MNEPDRQPQPFTFTVSGIIASLLVLVVAATCVRLGFWQLDRLRQRRDRNARIEQRMTQGPVDVIAALRDTAGLDYRTIELTGTFDVDRSIVLPGRTYRGSPGVHLLTPLRVDGRGTAVLVNRGWVPAPDAASIDLEPFRSPAAGTTIDGLILPLPARRTSLAADTAAAGAEATFRRVWFTIDEPKLRAQFPYPLADFVVQELPDSGTVRDADPFPIRLAPPPLDEGPHLGYAVQWFSFAVIAIIGWLTLARRSTRPANTAAKPRRTS